MRASTSSATAAGSTTIVNNLVKCLSGIWDMNFWCHHPLELRKLMKSNGADSSSGSTGGLKRLLKLKGQN